RLRKVAEKTSKISLNYHSRVESIDQNENYASVMTEAGTHYKTDILIGADGHRSVVRQYIAPNNPDATCAGSIVWIIDPINESIIATIQDTSHLQTGVQMVSGLNAFMLRSVLDDKEEERNSRIGAAWYDDSSTEDLRRVGAVTNNIVNHSLHGRDLPE